MGFSRDEAARASLQESLGELSLRSDDDARDRCSRDQSPFRRRPLAVLEAHHADHLTAGIRAARAAGVPVTARAGGSGVAGQCLGTGLIIDVSGIRGIEIERDGSVRCGAGETLDAVNARLAEDGRMIGPDVTSSASARVGGLIATNACGARSIRHGRFADALLEADVVLADGEPATMRAGEVPETIAPALDQVADGLEDDLAGWPRVPRSPGGYRLPEFAARRDALSLLPGSEGTLCLIDHARLATIPLPEARTLTLLSFPTLRTAIDAAPGMASTGASAVEVLDAHLVAAAREEGLDELPADSGAALIVEHRGPDDQGFAVARTEAGLAGATVLTGDSAERAWEMRGRALRMVTAGGLRPIAIFEDPAVSPEKAGPFCDALLELLRRYGLEAIVYGHAAAGCLHVRPLCDPADPTVADRLVDASIAVCELVGEWGGSMTGEHGWGLARSHLVSTALGERVYERFIAVKRAFDPDGVLNPGIVVGGHDPRALLAP